jgi:glycosyltransferase involved in cell wall biosynthesis
MKTSSLPETILMTADTLGGVWTYSMELIRALEPLNIQVHLATMGQKLSVSQQRQADERSNLKVHESTFALEWMDDPWHDVDAAGDWLLDLAREVHPDIIHLNNYAHGALPWKVPVVIVGHSCVRSWWQAVKQEEAPSQWNIYTERVREGLQGADHVVGVTGYMLGRLQRYYGPLRSTDVIYNARNESVFRPRGKEPFVFSMGRLWDEGKNIGALQAVAPQLSWPVYVAGEDRGRLDTDQDSTGNIHFPGQLGEREVAGWLGRASIFVLPARYDPFGLSALEAALSGCALILGDIPSLREVWHDAALYVDPDQPEMLEWHIQRLIRQPESRKRMAWKARLRATSFSFRKFARQYAALYRLLLTKERTGSIRQQFS